jgi:hypothetical protein
MPQELIPSWCVLMEQTVPAVWTHQVLMSNTWSHACTQPLAEKQEAERKRIEATGISDFQVRVRQDGASTADGWWPVPAGFMLACIWLIYIAR